ncbi:hypothetical protein JB92DRAFT_3126295 [Gautieria morchelliformis]|nr:hypothetical protein JB92DRAFT_3126295 [Gautieria morchelliformis]
MGVRPGGKQSHLRDTIIPLNNPPPKPGHPNMRGQTQQMVYRSDYMDEKLCGQPKGMRVVLQEWEWDKLTDNCKGKVPVGKCKDCTKSQVKKDAERRVAEAEAIGQEDTVAEEDIARSQEPEAIRSKNDWCCMYRVLLLQEDFANKKSMLQHYIEGRGHICMFLPKFHCELNPIKMVWGFMKYHK